MTSDARETAISEATVTVSFDIDEVLRRGGFLGEDDYGRSHYGPSFTERVAQLAAEKIAKEVLDDTLKKAIGDVVTAQVSATVESAMSEPVQRTTSYGSPIGEASPLRDVLAAEAQETVKQWMTASADRYGDKSKMRKFLEDVADRAIREDLNGELAKARAAVSARVQAEASRLVAEAAMKAVGR